MQCNEFRQITFFDYIRTLFAVLKYIKEIQVLLSIDTFRIIFTYIYYQSFGFIDFNSFQKLRKQILKFASPTLEPAVS